MNVQTLERFSLESVAKDMNFWCKASIEDLNRFKYILGPFDGLNSDLIQELLNILCERKELKVSHLHVLAHSNIKHLDLSICSSLISDQLITAVGYRCKKLTQLSLKNCSRLTAKALKKLPINLPCLQLIDLSGCFACTDEVLNLLGSSCPELRVLRIESCCLVTDTGVDGLCGDDGNPKCRKLREVNFTSTGLTSYGLQKILVSQVELQKFSLAMTGSGEVFKLSSGCLSKSLKLSLVDLSYTSITDTFIKNLCEICPLLCELSINGCSSVTGVSLPCVASLTHLRALSIADNKAIKFHPHLVEFLSKSGNLLQMLNISGMKNVDTEVLGVYCKSIKCLVMADCRDVTGSCIRVSTDQESKSLTLAQACPKLNTLNLHNCHFTQHKPLREHLTMILSSSREFQELDLSGIEHLSDEIIIEFIRSSVLSKLRSMNLSRCCEISVESVELLLETCTGLTQINLSHCQNISLRDSEHLKKMSRGCGVNSNITWV